MSTLSYSLKKMGKVGNVIKNGGRYTLTHNEQVLEVCKNGGYKDSIATISLMSIKDKERGYEPCNFFQNIEQALNAIKR